MISENSLKEIAAIRATAKTNQSVVFVSGNFNVIHSGHVRLLRLALEYGEVLVVGLNPDETPGVILPQDLRTEGMKSLEWIHHVVSLKEPADTFIEHLKPQVVVKGKEHETTINPEVKVLAGYGGKLVFGSGELSLSSVDMIRSELALPGSSTFRKPKDFLSRHSISTSVLQKAIKDFQNRTVCVIGDTIVDEYVICTPEGMSREDPTIVVTPMMSEKYIGGAGIVASHARHLGARAHLISVTGDDETGVFARDSLTGYDVVTHMSVDSSRPTTLKQRFRANDKTLLRVNRCRKHSVAEEIWQKMYADFMGIVDSLDLVIFSDFNYGCLPQPLVDSISAECAKRQVMMVADCQSSSQIGDISRFKGMTLITPTEYEARIALKDFESGLVVLAEKLLRITESRQILLTLGAEGVLIHAFNNQQEWQTDRLPALNSAPRDVSGAGDSLLVVSALALRSGLSIWESSCIGSLAAACQVSRLGNIPLEPDILQRELQAMQS